MPTATNDHTAAAEVKRPTGLFLVVHYFLKSARRFHKALNPPINFRKRDCPSIESMAKNLMRSKRKIVDDPNILDKNYTHTRNGHLVERKTALRGGNRFGYLVAPIPQVED